MIVIGVDVGLTGAVAALDSKEGFIAVEDLPVSANGKIKWVDGMAFLLQLREFRGASVNDTYAFVEHIHAMPKLSTIAANSMGRTFGSVVAAIEIAGIPLELVSPQKWKKMLNLTGKDESISRAQQLFPRASLERKKDHNRAEALLIAHYALRHLIGRA